MAVSAFGTKPQAAKNLNRAERVEVFVPEAALQSLTRDHELLEPLLVTGAGYRAKDPGPLSGLPERSGNFLIGFCTKGTGWFDVSPRIRAVRQGDFFGLAADTLRAAGSNAARPWTLHWALARGGNAVPFLQNLGVTPSEPAAWLGDDLEIPRLFNEILHCLRRGACFDSLLRASQALAHLLAVAAVRRHEHLPEAADVARKVAHAIVYMSEHVGEPLRVAGLARMANLSPAHFTSTFKSQTGCSPRDYLHLLRIHHACQMLGSEKLSVKEIAARLGYQDPFHFSRRFKAFQGVSPTEYRDQGNVHVNP
jgi:AraC family transcriptional regulator, arabinose operon regulatory protein